MEGEEGTVENPPLFPDRINKSRYLITWRLIATFCLKGFEYRKPLLTQSPTVSIQHEA